MENGMQKGITGGDKSPGAYCVSCERFIGPELCCPYCDEPSRRRTFLLWYRTAVLLLAILGTFWLWQGARTHSAPLIQVAEITPLMNFARVSIQGTATRRPYIARRNPVDYISFELADQTGRMRVAVYNGAATELFTQNRIPHAGEHWRVTGSLSVEAGRIPRLRITNAEDLRKLPENTP